MYRCNNKFGRNRKAIIPVVLLLIIAGIIWYMKDYYHADNKQVEAALNSSDKVTVSKEDGFYFFDGEGENEAMIFYPGAKVEYIAYAPLMREIAEKGVDCILVKMPCNFAFLDINAADDIMNEYEYKEWYIAGHSLGGAMAAEYAADNTDRLAGLILMAAYPTKKLADDKFRLLSIYGSNDGVLSMNKMRNCKKNWPTDSEELCIDGGNHAYYGNYGKQRGDGKATITRAEQQKLTANAIIEWIKSNEE